MPTAPAVPIEELMAEGVAFRVLHGDAWPDEAVTFLRSLDQGKDHTLIGRWLAIFELMREVEEGSSH